MTPFDAASADAATLRAKTGRDHDVAIVLGSGWGPAAERLGEVSAEVSMADLAGFPPPAVAGHAGVVRSVDIGDGHAALVLVGRTHLYEGHPVERVVHGVRTAVAAGCRLVLLTNAAGAVDPGLVVGGPVLVADHLNLTGRSPLVGPEFVDLSDLYSARVRAVARKVDPSLPEAVYAAFHGPMYETPAEIRMARAMGAGLVGMSTALEAIAARHLGAEVAAVSLVTNPAAGVAAAPIDHAEVLAAGRASAPALGDLLAEVARRALATP
jgi:purine-nucleoside phosphorylase